MLINFITDKARMETDSASNLTLILDLEICLTDLFTRLQAEKVELKKDLDGHSKRLCWVSLLNGDQKHKLFVFWAQICPGELCSVQFHVSWLNVGKCIRLILIFSLPGRGVSEGIERKCSFLQNDSFPLGML